MAHTRLLLAGLLSVAGLGAALALGLRQHGPWQHPGAAPLSLVDPGAALLDTVRLQGRRVTASLSGTVLSVDEDGTVWLNDGAGTVPLSFVPGPELEVEDRLLVRGRLRARDGRRWLEVTGWSVVDRGAR